MLLGFGTFLEGVEMRVSADVEHAVGWDGGTHDGGWEFYVADFLQLFAFCKDEEFALFIAKVDFTIGNHGAAPDVALGVEFPM